MKPKKPRYWWIHVGPTPDHCGNKAGHVVCACQWSQGRKTVLVREVTSKPKGFKP